MPIVIRMSFPAGRYHATPWGRHVNEGAVEWPPSPWRMCRALVAIWKRTAPEIAADQMLRILRSLSEPPSFCLPDHRTAHTRHFMPWEKKGPQDRAMIFDTFVAINRDDPLYIRWNDVELAEDDRTVLQQLLKNLTSFGRAESWVEAQLVEEDVACPFEPNADSGSELVRVLCVDPSQAFRDEFYPKLDLKKLAAGKLVPNEFLFDVPRWHLCLDTQIIHQQRWSAVPGAKWVNYSKPSELKSVRTQSRKNRSYTVARFLLDGPVLPPMAEMVKIAERFRAAAMSRFGTWCQRNPAVSSVYRRTDKPDEFSSPILSGHEPNGALIKSGHGHAYYLPTPDPDDLRRIRFLTVVARGGLGTPEIQAISQIRELRDPRDEDLKLRLRVRLIGLGTFEDDCFQSEIFKSSKQFVSITPFLGPSHLGRRGQISDMKKAIKREWRRLRESLPEFQGIELLSVDALPPDHPACKGRPQPVEYRRSRSSQVRDGYRTGRMFKLNFDQLVPGPVSLGYASHYGFGLFAAMDLKG